MTEKKKTPFISYIIHLLCFIPYLLLLCASICGVEFGFFGNASTYYGWDAVSIALLVLVCIPVLPASALYQVIFLLVTRKRLSSRQKWISRILFLTIAGSLFLSCTIYQVMTENHENRVFEQDKETIEAYLVEAFGAENAAEMEVLRPSYHISEGYRVKTPLMESSFLVCLDEDHEEVISNYFCDAYSEEFDLETLMTQKLQKTYNLPAGTEPIVLCISFPYQMAFEQDTERLLDNCDYEFSCIYLTTDRYDQEEAIREINRFYTGYGKELLKRHKYSAMNFYVKEGEAFFACIQTIPSDEDEDVYHLNFSGYTDSNGKTSIPRENMDIRLTDVRPEPL